ncbi:DoxX family protein [Paenibacillus chitinolyticus]
MNSLNKWQYGAFILRIVLGLIFLVHGYQKFEGGLSGVAGFFGSLGLPGFMAYVVAVIELAGGILMLIGLGTRWIAAAFAVIMLVAIFTAKLSLGFTGGYELELALLGMSLGLFFTGKQFLALENVFSRGKANAQ